MPFTTIRRYEDCISGNRMRGLIEGERGKKGRRRKKKRGPDPHFSLHQPRRSPQSSTFDQTLLYCHLIYFFYLFYLFYLSHPIFLSSYTPSPQIHPPHRDEGQQKEKILRTIRRLRLSPSIRRKPKENTSIAIDQTRIRLQNIHQLVAAEKIKKERRRRKRKREKKNYLVTFTPPHQLSILILSLTYSIGFVTVLDTKNKKKRKKGISIGCFFSSFSCTLVLRYLWVEEGDIFYRLSNSQIPSRRCRCGSSVNRQECR